MKFNKVPAILGVVTAAVVVVVVLLVSGGEDAETPPADSADQTAQTSDAGSQNGSGGDSNAEGQGGGPEGQSGGSEPKPKPDPEPVIEVRDGEVVGGLQELAFQPGEQISFAVASDTADEIHFHGYDLYADIPAGGEGKIEAPAELEGVFEVELHDSGLSVAEVTVSP